MSTFDLLDPPERVLEPAAESTERISKPQPIAELVPQEPPRPAWVEIDLRKFRRNFEVISQDKPKALQLVSVIKDEAYGHGAYEAAKIALNTGASFLALSTVEEAITLRERGIQARMLMLGDRHDSELPWCVDYGLTCCLSEPHTAASLAKVAAQRGKRVPVHLKINTGMNRYGVRWNEAASLASLIGSAKSLVLEGALSHFAQSDELDKTFALLQLSRFQEAREAILAVGVPLKFSHLCNSGGFLDLPQAHFDMVRIGILALGVYPSSVCRRIPGIEAVMSVKARIAGIQNLQSGDTVGYGMRYTAQTPRRIAVLPVGYGDGFPRVRNQGCALIHGQRAPIVGGIAMDALMVDITGIPEARMWDEAVLMGRQGDEEITVHEVARLKNSVSYDVLTSWRGRLPRIYVNREG
jgi:alanine racemase